MSDQVADQAVEQPAAQPTSLQLSDILLTAQCIQLASQRGAFRAEEFTQVGGVYERLVAFLQASGALTQAPAETATETDTSGTDQPAA